MANKERGSLKCKYIVCILCLILYEQMALMGKINDFIPLSLCLFYRQPLLCYVTTVFLLVLIHVLQDLIREQVSQNAKAIRTPLLVAL